MARGTRAAAAEVLKHLMHPARLRNNPAVRGYFSADSAESDARAIERIKTVVEREVSRLPQLERTILRRCDIDGEMHRSVAADLALSVRHFYRLRARAIAAVAGALANGLRVAEVTAPTLDPLDVVLSHAEVFEQAGAPQEAVVRLARLAPALGPSPGRVTLECRIANIYANCGDLALAREHVAAASSVAATLPTDVAASASLEVEVAQAFLDAAAGDTRRVRAGSVHLVPALRRRVEQSAEPRIVEAMAVALVLRAERSRDAGLLGDAIAAASEAFETLRRSEGTRPILRLLSRHQALAALSLIPSEQQPALHDLATLSIEAARAGFMRESALIAGDLASLYRALGAPRRVLDVALPMLPAVRETCGRTNVAIILSDVGAAQAALGNYSSASELLDEAGRHATTLYSRAICDLRCAEVAFGRQRFQDAAGSAAAARDGFLALGNSRLAATSMRILAEVFEAQGQSRSAIQTISESLDLQGRSAFTYARVRVLRTAARITRDRRYLTTARELARS